MKTMMLLMALLTLAGCATDATGLRVVDLRDPKFFRTERTIPMTFPKIQMALFKHQNACGSAPEFAMDPRETNYATIIDKPADAEGFEQAVLVDVVQYQATMMEDPRSRARVYTYYADTATERRINQLFDAILHPEACPAT